MNLQQLEKWSLICKIISLVSLDVVLICLIWKAFFA